MKRAGSRAIVVDACVASAAGETEHPVSSACRESLIAIRDICHRVVMTEAMKREWDGHMSRFTRKWRVQMAARKKPLFTVEPPGIAIDDAGLSERDRAAIAKDRHLLEAALAADRVIVTADAAFRKALEKTPAGRRFIGQIAWIDPVTEGTKPLHALQRPARAKRTRR